MSYANNYHNGNKNIYLYESFYPHSFCYCCCSCCCRGICVITYSKQQQQHDIIGKQEQQQKLKIYINCFIFINNKCMTYIYKSSTPNDSIYNFTHCKAVMKLTVSNGLSVHTFIIS